MNMEELAWAAGLFEGEGTILWKHSGGRTKTWAGSLGLQMWMTDEDVMARFTRIMGGHLQGPYGPYGNGKKPLWRWDVSGSTAERAADLLEPWLCTRRRSTLAAIREKINARRYGAQEVIALDVAV